MSDGTLGSKASCVGARDALSGTWCSAGALKASQHLRFKAPSGSEAAHELKENSQYRSGPRNHVLKREHSHLQINAEQVANEETPVFHLLNALDSVAGGRTQRRD
ncbi:uncharacterized protein V6R79_015786 [Siganus canaliculatus]